MKKIHFLPALFSLFLLMVINFHSKAYEIKVKIDGLQDTSLILAHYFTKSIYPDDTTYLDQNGEGIFKADKDLKGGMYVLYMPNGKMIEFLLDKDQDFTIKSDTDGTLASREVKGNEINQRFLDYQVYVQQKRKEQKPLQQQLKDEELKERKKKKIREELKEINNEVEERINKFISENQDNFFGTFLQAMKKVEVPDPPEDENGKVDSSWQYRYYRSHYFDHFDVGDVRLLHTPFYEQKIKTYISKVVPQVPDSLIKEVDMLIEKSKDDEDAFRYMLITLFNHFAKSKIMGMDKVYLHIAEKYYIPEAHWAKEDFIEKLKKHVRESKNIVIGNTAPDIQLIHVPDDHFTSAANDTALMQDVYVGRSLNLHDIKSEYTILIFWEKDCGHCRKSLPKLHKIYNDTLKDLDVTVVSFHMLFGKEGKEKWIKFINKHDLYGWMNVWNPYSYDFKKAYNIKSTPILLVLDKKKKIMAKKIEPDKAEQIILQLIKNKHNEKTYQ